MLTLPTACVLCGAAAETDNLNLCDACLHDLPILPHHCPQCAHFLPANGKNTPHCGHCQQQSPPFHRTFALFPYQFPIISLITRLKFQHQLDHAALFGRLLVRQIRQHWYRDDRLPDLILPVPLHTSRLRERGFNQAHEIARPVGRTLGIPIDRQNVIRQKMTAAQRQLPAKQRKLNIQDAFRVNRMYTGQHLAVIDDVITTGQTVSELCRLLRLHGACKIDVWCVARQGQPEARRLTRTHEKR